MYIINVTHKQNNSMQSLITSTEVKHAIKKLKNNKATGTDLIAAEMLKALDDGPIEKLTQLCNEIYSTGYWPKEKSQYLYLFPRNQKQPDVTNTGQLAQ